MDEDKKHLGEDVFTLDEIVKMILAKKSTDGQVVWAMGKLIKEVKKQFLLKYSLEVESFDQFPSGQEIPTELIHTCFEMECTKVLLKNQIWTELTNFLPGEP